MADGITVNYGELDALNKAVQELARNIQNVQKPLKNATVYIKSRIYLRYRNSGPNVGGGEWKPILLTSYLNRYYRHDKKPPQSLSKKVAQDPRGTADKGSAKPLLTRSATVSATGGTGSGVPVDTKISAAMAEIFCTRTTEKYHAGGAKMPERWAWYVSNTDAAEITSMFQKQVDDETQVALKQVIGLR